MTSLFRVGDARELCSNGRNFPAIYLNHSTGQGPGSLVKNKDPENICNGYFISSSSSSSLFVQIKIHDAIRAHDET